MSTAIGWKVKRESWSIKQGDSGTKRVILEVQNADGSPYPNFDGWTAQLVLTRPPSQLAEISLTPTVVGDAGAQTLVIDLAFVADTTKNVSPGTLFGDLLVVEPSGGRHHPVNVTLDVTRSYGATP